MRRSVVLTGLVLGSILLVSAVSARSALRALREHRVSNGAMEQEVDRMTEELARMRKLVAKLASVEAPDPADPPLGDRSRWATSDDFRGQMHRIRREMAELALALNHLGQRDAAPEPASVRTHRITESDQRFDLHVAGEPTNREVVLRNLGDDIVVNPRLVANDRNGWFTTEDIVREALQRYASEREDTGAADTSTSHSGLPGPDAAGVDVATMSDGDRAMAIWSFLKESRYHDEPAADGLETHDPVRYLNAYGYGFCDDSATSLMLLAEAAGLKARVWGIYGHVVPEVYFDGAWHMLDPDGEVYYLDDAGQIASVETLAKRPDIIRKSPSAIYPKTESLVEMYTTTDDNQVSDWYRRESSTTHSMDFSLRPGESIARSWGNWGLYFSDRYLSEPRSYGNGRFVFAPVFRDEIYHKGTTAQALHVVPRGDAWALAVSPGAETGTLRIPVSSPYPLLAGNVKLAGDLGQGGRVEARLSEDGEAWWTAVEQSGTGAFDRATTTRPFFRNGYGRPMYAYQLELELTAPARLDRLVVESDFQHAPGALPALLAETNRLHYTDDTQGERTVEVVYRFDQSSPDMGAHAAR
jgi:hypothetical protein